METLVVEKKTYLNSVHRNDMLKLVALLTMLIDHIGLMFFPNEMLFRIIGRLAFPIFAYQITQGYARTSNLKRYVLRIFIFAAITQIPYSFFNPELKFNPLHLNILFTFVTAIGLLYIYDMGILKLKSFLDTKNYISLFYGASLLAVVPALIALPEVASFIVKDFYLEFGMLALALVLLFHIFQNKTGAAMISIALLYIFHGYYRVALWNSAYSSTLFWSNLFSFKYVWNQLNLQNGFSQLQRYYFNAWGILALIPILGLESINLSWIRLNKYIGYIFYPAHMSLLILIALLLKV